MIMLSTILFAVLILVITSNSFLYGMWGLGVSMFFVSFMVFGNIGVEVFNDVAWNSGLSIWLIIMSLWVGGISYLCSSYQSVKRSVVFSVSVLCLVIICILVFVVSSWFLFFFFFESSLVPIIFLILGWGYQPERLQASFYLLLYTVCVSLPMLLVLLYMCVLVGGNSFYYVCDWESNSFIFMILLLAPFFVKSPMFLVHLWLPKAHVEAPVSGSMMLAGVLLKFGGYGMIMVFYWFSFSVNCLFLFVICFCLWGGLLSGLICIRQVDVKSLIAYSSVGHMSLCLSGVMSCMGLGWLGGLLMMLGHGLCSSGLFGLAGYAYKVCSSRALVLCSGFLVFMPSMSICWFLLCSSNMSFPPSLGLLSEIFLMVALVGFSLWLMIPLGLMVFVVGVYSLILYGYSQHGSECGLSFGGKLLGFDYMLMTFLLWVPLNLLSVCSDLLIGWV